MYLQFGNNSDVLPDPFATLALDGFSVPTGCWPFGGGAQIAEDTMQTSPAQISNVLLQAERIDRASVLARLLAFFSNLLNVRGRMEDEIAARYEGCAWCDSTEQQITRDITRF